MGSVIFIAGSGVGGSVIQPARYWRIAVQTAFGASNDYMVAQIQLFEDTARTDLGLRATITDSGGLSQPDDAELVAKAVTTPVGTNKAPTTQSYFEGTRGAAPYYHNFDFGAGNLAQVNAVRISAGSVGGEVPRDFDVEYSTDNVIWTKAWESGATTAYANYEKKEYTNPSAPAAATGLFVESAKAYAVIGRRSDGISVQQGRAYAIVGRYPDGPNITDNTTYAVVTP